MDELESVKTEQATEAVGAAQEDVQPTAKKQRILRKPTAFERRVEAHALDRVTKALDERLDPAALTDSDAGSPEEQAPVSGPENADSDSSVVGIATPLKATRNPESEETADAASSFRAALRLLQSSEVVASNPKAMRLLADFTELAQGGAPIPQPRASHVIQPSGGGLSAPDPRGEYERRVATLRPGDVAGLMELKREFRKRGLEVY